jgi:preprotein translocase subunit YajC
MSTIFGGFRMSQMLAELVLLFSVLCFLLFRVRRKEGKKKEKEK